MRAGLQIWLDYLPDPEEGTIVPSTPAFFGDFWPMACFSRFKLAIRAKDNGFPLSPMSPVFISGPEAFPASDVEDSESDAPRNELCIFKIEVIKKKVRYFQNVLLMS